jgi:DNA-binding CsgD family transcriptional regulator
MLNAPTEQRRRVLELHSKGLTPREIAKLLDLSAQRVYQQLKKLEVAPNPRKL